jgi:acetolactate synthase I/II/III large subunit
MFIGSKRFLSQTILINRGGPLLYSQLKKHKVEDVFIYSGGAVMPLIDAFYKNDINTIVNANELCTGMSAIGYAKASSKVGVCLVTSGPGITNMITPLLDAKNDGVPLVVFSGQVPLSAEGTNAFQEAPAVALTEHVTKWSYKLENINDMEAVIDEAFTIATLGNPGPVHIDIPKCVSYQIPEYYSNSNFSFNLNTTINPPKIDIKQIETVANLINKSKKPILYIGQGCKEASALLRVFAIKANIPVTSTIHGTGIFDEHHDLSLRWCGMHGYAPANYCLQEADTIIAIGSRFDDRTTGNLEHYAPKAFEASKFGSGGIIHVNIDKSSLDFVVKSHYNFHSTSKDFLETIIPLIDYSPRFDWFKRINSLKYKHPFKLKVSNQNQNQNQNLHMEEVINELYKQTLDKNVIFTTGVGNHQMQTYQFVKSQYPTKIISSGSLGVMGAGLPYAIGAQLSKPNKLVVCIDGDSSFNMTLSDMKTIVENKLPIKIAIMNNSAQMMVTIWEKLFFNERYTATLNEKNPDYYKLADAFGIKSLKCNHVNELEKTIDEFIHYDGPILCEFKIKQDICLPLVGPGKALDDMILDETIMDSIVGMAPS